MGKRHFPVHPNLRQLKNQAKDCSAPFVAEIPSRSASFGRRVEKRGGRP